MATVEELRDYVENTLDIRTTTRMTKNELQAIIDAEDGAENPEPKEAVKLTQDTKNTTKIIISSNGKETTPVFVAVNGKGYTVPRDVEVEVPNTVIEALNNAVQETMKNGKMISSKRFNYSVLG